MIMRLKEHFIKLIFLLPVFGLQFCTEGRQIPEGQFRGVIHRPDGNEIVFNLSATFQKGKTSWVISNAGEKIELKNIHIDGDSIFAEFPVFESQLHLKEMENGVLKGKWYKGSEAGFNTQDITLTPNQDFRFTAKPGQKDQSISGKWKVTFTRTNKTTRPSIAEFVQSGNKLTGTFLNPSGDYRFLEGVVSGDSLKLSTFDGSHAFYFEARILNDQNITGGLFCSGTGRTETWTAIKDDLVSLDEDLSAANLKDGATHLDFTFPDLEGKQVSIKDERFKNKVVIIQLMGSWCSNCMDETIFLSNYYNTNRSKGIEVIALAYEYSHDLERSKRSIRKFQKAFDVQYPMLITGALAGDSLKTEKTLPQITPIKVLPTTIFIGKDGAVKKIHTGFFGPGTGEHYEKFKKDFHGTVDQLLTEN